MPTLTYECSPQMQRQQCGRIVLNCESPLIGAPEGQDDQHQGLTTKFTSPLPRANHNITPQRAAEGGVAAYVAGAKRFPFVHDPIVPLVITR